MSARSALLAALLAALIVCTPTSANGSPVPFSALVAAPDIPGRLLTPGSVVVDPLGPVIVTDTGYDRVRILMPDGTLAAQMGGPGSGAGQLSKPQAATIGLDGRIYVADTGNRRIQVYTAQGEFVRTAGGPSTLSSPAGVVADAQGNAYVTDAILGEVQVYNAQGVLTRKVAEGHLRNPGGLAITSDGRLVIADTANRRIAIYTASTGALVGEWGISTTAPYVSRYASPVNVTLNSSGQAIVTDMGGLRIERCSVQVGATALQTWTGSPLQPGNALGQFDTPKGAAQAAGGMLYVADTANSRIQRWESSTWLSPWNAVSTATHLPVTAEAIANTADGGVVVADAGRHAVLRYDSEGAYLGSWGSQGTGNGMFSGPKGVAVAANGDIYVADSGNKRIQRLNASGQFVSAFGGGVVNDPRGMCISADGVLFVTDAGNDRVERFSLTGGHLGSIGAPGTGNGQLTDPTAVAVRDQALWVADTGNHRVQRFVAGTGQWRLTFGSRGNGDGQFESPRGIAVISDGTLVVADTGNDRLQRFDAGGSFIQVAGGSGAWPGRFLEPVHLSVFGPRLWVVERTGRRVQALVQDNVAPVTVAHGVPSQPVNTNVSIYLEATDFASGVRATYYRIGSGAVTPYTGGTIHFTAEDTHVLRYWSVDRSGNIESEKTATFVIDRTPPSGTVALQGGATHVNFRNVTLANSVTGASQMRVTDANGTGAWVAFAATASALLPDVDGLHSVTIAFRDVAGNVLTRTVTVTLDRIPPAGTVTISPDRPYTNSRTVAVASAVAGAHQMRVIDANGTGPWITYSADATALLPDADGLHTVQVEYRDQAGNTLNLSGTVTLDRVPPSGTVTVEYGKQYVNYRTLRVDSQVLDALEIRVSAGESTSGWEPYAAVVEFMLPDEDAAYTVRVEYRDRARNVLTLTRQVTLDRLPPSGTLAISPGKPFVAFTVVPVHSQVAGATSMRVTDANGVGEFVPFSAVTFATLPDEDGVHSVTVDYRDEAGNILTLTGEVTLDRVRPWADVEVVLPARHTAVTRAEVDVRVSDITRAHELRLFDSSGEGDWIAVDGRTELTLGATLFDVDGVHEVAVELRSLASLTSTFTASVTLDREPPTIGYLTAPTHPLGKLVRFGTTARFEWSSMPDLAGVTGYSWVFDGFPSTEPAQVAFGQESWAVASAIPGGEWYFHVRAVDGAGNWGPAVHLPVELTSETRLGSPVVGVTGAAPGAVSVSAAGSITSAAGGRPVAVRAQRLTDDRWRDIESMEVLAVATGTGAGSYRAEFVLSPGQWRFIAEAPMHGYVDRAVSAPSNTFTVR